MKIIINVPSIYPKLFEKFIISFRKMQSLKNIFDVHLVGQNPWTEDELKHSMADYTSLKERLIVPSMLSLRLDTVDKFSNYDYVMFCDDDLIFPQESEQYINKIVEVLKKQQPDVLLTRGLNYQDIDFNPKNAIMTINRGMFVKIKSIPDNNEFLLGGLEDAVIGFSALENNGKLIRMGGSPIVITSRQNNKRNHMSYDNKSTIHNLSIVDTNCGLYIRKKYNDPNWQYFTGEFPIGLNYHPNNKAGEI